MDLNTTEESTHLVKSKVMNPKKSMIMRTLENRTKTKTSLSNMLSDPINSDL